MKPKKLLMIAAASLLSFTCIVACSENPGDETDTRLTVSDTELEFSAADDAAQTVAVTSKQAWTTDVDAAWIHIDENDAESKFTVTVDENTDTAPRTGHITVDNGDPSQTRTIAVTQEAAVVTRYQTVPFAGMAENDPGLPTGLLEWSFDYKNIYYVFLLGHVNSVPIAYKEAVAYNGMTPITVEYSRSNATEQSVMNSVTNAVENSVTNSRSVNFSVSVGAFGIGAQAGGEFSWEDTQTRSTSNTYETTQTIVSGENFGLTFTVGNNGEKAGKYRWALFATTDVYYVLTLNRDDLSFKEAHTVVCARPETAAWAIDHEPDPNGNFGKTGAGDLLEIPELDYETLPNPDDLPPYKTTFTKQITGDHQVWLNVNWYDRITGDLDITRLIAEGYNAVSISVNADFEIEALFSPSIGLNVYGGHGDYAEELLWGNGRLETDNFPIPTESDNKTVTVVERLPIADFDNNFTLMCHTNTTDNMKNAIGTRTVTVEAVR